MRLVLAVILCKVLRFIGGLVGKGSSLPGQAALKVCPSVLGRVKLPPHIIAVSGSYDLHGGDDRGYFVRVGEKGGLQQGGLQPDRGGGHPHFVQLLSRGENAGGRAPAGER